MSNGARVRFVTCFRDKRCEQCGKKGMSEFWRSWENGMWGGKCWKGNVGPSLTNEKMIPVSSVGEMLGPNTKLGPGTSCDP